ncbi:MAG: sigma-54 dependent transcriptional regulator [Myxococcota bacterium]
MSTTSNPDPSPDELLRLPDRAHKPSSFHGMVTASAVMLEFFEMMQRVSRTDASVLIRGETGTGKELVAKALHEMSPRSGKAFRALNCATLTPDLLASELFGHVKGAFTGAIRDRQGLFKLADGGTIFLDEVAELPLELQARLLRVLQEQAFVPVGATKAERVDVRVISATHQSLRDAVDRRAFRADLMYRIRVVPLFLPPLAERRGDVEALTWHFIEQFNQNGWRVIEAIEPRVMRALVRYEWPGNVRELKNALQYAYAVGLGAVYSYEDLTPELRGEPPPMSRLEPPRTEEELEHQRLMEALRATGGHKGEAAGILGISRTTLWRKLREHGIS